MKVSIIIPAYNSARFISVGLESSINQTYKNIEIIVVDDGSSDDTATIVKEFIRKDNRIKLFKKENGGVSSARNLGIYKSTGDYIIFLDADDWLEEDAVEQLINEQNNHSNCFICCDCFFVDDNTKNYKKSFENSNNSITLLDSEQAIIDSLNTNYRLSSSCYKLFSTKILKDYRITFDSKIFYAEDGLFTFSYLIKCEKILYCPIPLWNILNRDDSASNAGYNKKMVTLVEAYEAMINLSSFSKKATNVLISNLVIKSIFLLSICLKSNLYEYKDALIFKRTIKKYKKCRLPEKITNRKKFFYIVFPIWLLRIIYTLKK